MRERQVVKLREDLEGHAAQYVNYIADKYGWLYVVEQIHYPHKEQLDTLITVKSVANGQTAFLSLDEVEALDGDEQDI